jgi:glycosyltransferase 2 family protein
MAGQPARAGWRDRLFGRAGEEHFQRRTSDWIRLGTGIAIVVIAARHAGDVTATERAVLDLVNTLPPQLVELFRALYRLGALWAVGLVVVAALVGRRWHLARDLLLAGIVTLIAARAVGEIVVAHETFGHGVRVAAGFGGSPSFPAVRAAVTVAVISAAGPYVTRATRVVGRVLVVGLAVAALYLGHAYPNDLLAAIVLGWTVAAAVHLLFGSPGGRPTVEQVTASLAQLGIDARAVRLAEHQRAGSTVMFADDAEGLLRVKVIGRDEADARLLAKAWRFLFYRDSGPPLTLTRLQQVEHEAYLMLVARDAGARVPPVLAAGIAGPGAALLVQRTVGAVPLAELDPNAVTDDLLVAIWTQVATLQRVRIAHGLLDAEHVVISPDGPWIVGFDDARATGDDERHALDIAELLVATASLVGEDRAVRAAVSVLGQPKLVTALPFLQTAALTRTTRGLAGDHRKEVSDLLERLRQSGAAATGVEPPELTQLHRLNPTNVAMAIGALVATAVLLNQVGDPGELWATVRSADWSWIALAFVFSFASNIGYAIGLMGTVPLRLPLWPTTEVQLGMSFSNLAVPAIGGQGMQVRYLQKMGIDLSSAVAAGGVLSTVANLITALGLFVLAVAISPTHADFSLLPTTGLLELTVIVIVVVALASAVVFAVPKLRRVTVPPVQRATSTMRIVLRSPTKLTLLIGGNAIAILLSTACLAACLAAFGATTSFWSLMAANIAVMTVASTVPIPGGSAAVGTVGLSAVLVSFGIPDNVAVAAALANQLVYSYLPAIPGWFATKHLFQHDYL